MKTIKKHFPPIGMRIIKSAIAVLLCFVIYLLRGRQGIVFYTQLAALWCMQPYVENSLKNALQRTIGTFIGAAYGLIVILIDIHFIPQNDTGIFIKYIIISVMIIPVIHTTIIINKKNASYFSCVVFLSIVVLHLVDDNPYLFVFNRVTDTLIGIIIGVGVNTFRLPRRKQNDILFISGMDDTLLTMNETLTPYSRIELNQMIRDGAKFTLSTMRTPASLMVPMHDIDLKLPVIAMDGAVLYDVKNKAYKKYYAIEDSLVNAICMLYNAAGLNYFVNAIVENILVIYYGDFKNEAEQKLYEEMNNSPYRNYLKHHFFNQEDVIYFMSLCEDAKAQAFYDELSRQPFFDRLRCRIYASTDYLGYTYIKIYDKNATRENMIAHLVSELDVTRTVTFGSIEGKYDVLIEDNDSNKVVKTIKKMYEPYIWKCT